MRAAAIPNTQLKTNAPIDAQPGRPLSPANLRCPHKQKTIKAIDTTNVSTIAPVDICATSIAPHTLVGRDGGPTLAT